MSDSDLAVLPSEPALSQYPSSTWTCSSPEPINRDLPIAPDSDAPDASDAPEGDGRDADSESDVTPGEPKSVGGYRSLSCACGGELTTCYRYPCSLSGLGCGAEPEPERGKLLVQDTTCC